jgi:hypothetical protein
MIFSGKEARSQLVYNINRRERPKGEYKEKVESRNRWRFRVAVLRRRRRSAVRRERRRQPALRAGCGSLAHSHPALVLLAPGSGNKRIQVISEQVIVVDALWVSFAVRFTKVKWLPLILFRKLGRYAKTQMSQRASFLLPTILLGACKHFCL